jgi:hypothetical protein
MYMVYIKQANIQECSLHYAYEPTGDTHNVARILVSVPLLVLQMVVLDGVAFVTGGSGNWEGFFEPMKP